MLNSSWGIGANSVRSVQTGVGSIRISESVQNPTSVEQTGGAQSNDMPGNESVPNQTGVANQSVQNQTSVEQTTDAKSNDAHKNESLPKQTAVEQTGDAQPSGNRKIQLSTSEKDDRVERIVVGAIAAFDEGRTGAMGRFNDWDQAELTERLVSALKKKFNY